MSEINKNTVVEIFSERLTKARNEKNITQSKLAEKINVAASTISSYENLKQIEIDDKKPDDYDKAARRFPSIYTACKIAKELNCSLDWLCGLTDSKDETENEDMKILRFIVDMIEKKKEGWLIVDIEDLGTVGNKAFFGPVIGVNEAFCEFIKRYKKACDMAKEAKKIGLDDTAANAIKEKVYNDGIDFFRERKAKT